MKQIRVIQVKGETGDTLKRAEALGLTVVWIMVSNGTSTIGLK